MMIFRPQGLIPPKAATYTLPKPWDKLMGTGKDE
jgi:hypothetical protein